MEDELLLKNKEMKDKQKENQAHLATFNQKIGKGFKLPEPAPSQGKDKQAQSQQDENAEQ